MRRLCRVLRVSASGFYDWLKRPDSARTREDRRLLVQIKAIHQESRCSYGSPRVHAELRARGEICGVKRVARLMRQNGISATIRRRWRPTGAKGGVLPAAENKLATGPAISGPDQVWAADLTYIRTGEGWLYLGAVMDLFSRRIVGWATSGRMTRQLVIDALVMALNRRRPSSDLIHHSDRGSQYASYDFQKLLEQHGIACSMCGKGNCYDNAAMESFFSSLKAECVRQRRYRSRSEARDDLFDYIEVFYNRKRRHSTLGYLSPAEYEKRVEVA